MLDRLDDLVALCRRRGFAFPSAEVYGVPTSTWDYGPLGVELKENVRREWWRAVVQGRDDVVGLDSAVLLPAPVWQASGHLRSFVDGLTECGACHHRFRLDRLAGSATAPGPGDLPDGDLPDGDLPDGDLPDGGLAAVACPNCGVRGAFGEQRAVGGVLRVAPEAEHAAAGPAPAYLRPETAQGAFLNLGHVLQSSRMRPPFGIAQVGRAFRNEVPPGEFLFRMPEFDQMELEYFVEPGTSRRWQEYWLAERTRWYTALGIDGRNLRHLEQSAGTLGHHPARTAHIEYRFRTAGRDWAELEAVADRADADLAAHATATGVDLSHFDQVTGVRYLPHVVGSAAGLSRAVLAFLLEAFTEDAAPNARGVPERRTVLRLDPRLAPVKVAVLPLSRNAELSPKAHDLAAELRRVWTVEFDDAGAIGRRYRRQDEVGTPYCVTVDFDTLADGAVTVRERDSMRQDRIGLSGLRDYLSTRLAG